MEEPHRCGAVGKLETYRHYQGRVMDVFGHYPLRVTAPLRQSLCTTCATSIEMPFRIIADLDNGNFASCSKALLDFSQNSRFRSGCHTALGKRGLPIEQPSTQH